MENSSVPLVLFDAYTSGTPLDAPPSALNPAFSLADAYAVEAELVRLKQARGARPIGRKVGFANRAMWRILKLETLVWAHMYDDTVVYARSNAATLSLARRVAPRIEPEIVLGLRQPLPPGVMDAAEALASVEWLALGFEINDCLFPDWKFKPADFVAAFGFHTALVVGEPRPAESGALAALADELSRFTLQLSRDGHLVAEGAGKNALKSPALCLAELAGAIARQPGADPLAAGELISTGTLTDAQPIAAGQTWRAHVEGLNLPDLTLALA